MSVINENKYFPWQEMPLGINLRSLYPYLEPAAVRAHYNLYLGYIRKLNALLAEDTDLKELKELTLGQIVGSPWEIPVKLRNEVMHLAGGVLNHELYFSTLKRTGDTMPPPKVRSLMGESFGSYEGFVGAIVAAAQRVYGSGWLWLIKNHEGKLSIAVGANHESPLTHGVCPLWGVDLWEHAYYCTFKSDRERYIRSLLALCDWRAVEAAMMNC